GVPGFLGRRPAARLSTSAPTSAEDRAAPEAAAAPGFDRRRFLLAGGAAAAFAAVTGFAGQYLVRRSNASASRAAVRIPAPADPAAPIPAGADLGVPGVVPFTTPNRTFYRVDTALFVPAVDATGWALNVHGMIDRPITIDYEQLLARPLI